MADIKVQHGNASIPLSTASVTITAGTDYTAPASLSNAFIRIVGIDYTGAGCEDSDFAGGAGRNAVSVSNPGNLLTSITFERTDATSGPINISYEIVEYTGSVGGENEFVVRHQENIAGITTLTVDSATVSGVVTDADVVVFITGFEVVGSAGRGDSGSGKFTWEYVGASNVARGTQGNTTRSCDVSIAVVEFTGSNWTVQRIAHQFTSGGVTETEAITSVGAVTNAFLHPQSRFSASNIGPDDAGLECWLSSATELSFLTTNVADATHDVITWVVDNPNMTVQHVSGARANGAGGASPDVWTETISNTASTIEELSVMGECGRSDATNDTHLLMISFEVTSLTQVTLTRGRDTSNRDYRFSVVEWPTAGGATTHEGSGNLQSGDSDLSGDGKFVLDGSGNLQSGDSTLAGSGEIFNLDSVDDPIAYGDTFNFTTSGFSTVTSRQLTDKDSNVISLSGTDTTATLPGLQDGIFSVTIGAGTFEVSDGSRTDNLTTNIQAPAGFDFVALEAGFDTSQNSFLFNFSGTPTVGMQFIYTTSEITLFPDGSWTAPSSVTTTITVIDPADGFMEQYDMIIGIAEGDLASGDSQLSGTGEVTKEGSGDLLSGDSDLSGTGEIRKDGSGNLQSGDSDLSATGEIINEGSGNLQSSDSLISGTGEIINEGAGNLQSGDSTLNGSGSIVNEGTGNLQSGDSLLNGSGEAVAEGEGTGDLQSGNSTVSGSGQIEKEGAGNLQSGDSDLSGSGEVIKEGTSNLQSGDSVLSGNGSISLDGSGNLQSSDSLINGVGQVVSEDDGLGNLQSGDSKLEGQGFSFEPNLELAPSGRTYAINSQDRTIIVKPGVFKVKRINKTPDAILNYTFDLSNWLEPSDTVQSANFVLSDNLTLVAQEINNSSVTALVAGGAQTGEENLKCVFTTTEGYTDSRTIVFEMISL